MKVTVRKGYVFFKGAQAFPGGAVVDNVTEEEYKGQHWKLEVVPEVSGKMVTEKTVLNRAMRGVTNK